MFPEQQKNSSGQVTVWVQIDDGSRMSMLY